MIFQDFFEEIPGPIVLPGFVRDPDFLSGVMFSRYVTKCEKRLNEFMRTNIIVIGSSSSIDLTSKFLTSYFHLIRTGGKVPNGLLCGPLSIDCQCDAIKNDTTYHELLLFPYNEIKESSNAADKYSNFIDILTGSNFQGHDAEAFTKDELYSFLDYSMETLLNAEIRNFKSDSEEKDSFDVRDIFSKTLKSYCAVYLEQQCVKKKLQQTQINTQAVPETDADCYEFYTNLLALFHINLAMEINDVAYESCTNKRAQHRIAKFKEQLQDLKKTVTARDKAISQLELELQKKSTAELQTEELNTNSEKIKELETNIVMLKKQLNKAKDKVSKLETANNQLKTELEIQTNKRSEMQNDTSNKSVICDFTKRYGFVCQHKNLNSKLMQAFPNSIIIDKPLNNLETLKLDAVVGITSEISHPLYNATKRSAAKVGIPFIHCNEVNISKIAECIAINSN